MFHYSRTEVYPMYMGEQLEWCLGLACSPRQDQKEGVKEGSTVGEVVASLLGVFRKCYLELSGGSP